MYFSSFKRVYNYIYRHIFTLFFSHGFKSFGSKVSLVSPDRIEGQQFIDIGTHTTISRNAWLLALHQDELPPTLSIGNNNQLGRFIHIVSIRKVIIGSNVLIADKVYISDNTHCYTDIRLPVLEQPIEYVGGVIIGDNSWIGENVSIVGAVIGKHCIIGTNSVVRGGEFPDYSVIVGAPARIVKRYNPETSNWDRTDAKGIFL